MYQIRIEVKEGYIYAHVTGVESLENSRAYWREIAAVCRERAVKKVLVEDYLVGYISDLDVHTFAKTFTQETGMAAGSKIASVSKPEKLPAQQFAETVAHNWTGVKVKVFLDVEEARAWLLG